MTSAKIDDSELENVESLTAVVQEITEGMKLIDLVTSLGVHLTNEDGKIRGKALNFLAETVDKLSEFPFDSETIHSLMVFFTSRMEDWPSQRAAVAGLNALLKRPIQLGSVVPEDAELAARQACTELQVQALSQPQRLACFELFLALATLHVPAVTPLLVDFTNAIITAVDGEKDPRCLLVAFRLVSGVTRLFSGEKNKFLELSEELFDVVSAYFPISFTPPPNDPGTITREDLKSLLEDALCSTPLFLPHLFPLLLEKLSSSLTSAKRDSLQCLSRAAQNFPEETESFCQEIWAALKKELLSPETPPEISVDVETSLKNLLNSFNKPMGERQLAPPGNLLLDIIMADEVFESVLESFVSGQPENKVSERILITSAQASSLTAGTLSLAIVPSFLEALRPANKELPAVLSHKKEALNFLVEILECGGKEGLGKVPETSGEGGNFTHLFLKATNEGLTAGGRELTEIGLRGISAISRLPLGTFCSLSLENASLAAESLTSWLLNQSIQTPPLIDLLTSALVNCVRQYGSVLESTLSTILTAVSGPLVEVSKSTFDALEAIAESSLPGVTTRVVDSLIETFSSAFQLEETSKKLPLIFEALSSLILKLASGGDSDARLSGFIERSFLFTRVQGQKAVLSTSLDSTDFYTVDASLSPFNLAVVSATHKLTGGAQQALLTKLLPSSQGLPAGKMERDFLASIICALDAQILKEVCGDHNIWNWLLESAMSAESPFSHWPARALGVLAFQPGAEVDAKLEDLLEKLTAQPPEEGAQEISWKLPPPPRLLLLSWLARSAASRGKDRQLAKALTLLLDTIGTSGPTGVLSWHSLAAARCLSLVLAPPEKSVVMGAVRYKERPLYRQKVFHLILDKFKNKVSSSTGNNSTVRSSVHLALASILQVISPQVVSAEMQNIFPLLLGALETVPAVIVQLEGPADVAFSLLLTLSSLLMDPNRGKALVANNLPAVAQRLVPLVQYKSSAAVREISLQCLLMAADFPHTLVFPLAKKVIEVSNKALDDPKKRVRKEAVKCRNVWLSIK